MKRILLISLLLACTVGIASAYGVNLSCPSSVQAGMPIKCSFDSDFPPGTSFDLVLYQDQYTATEIKDQPMTIQANQNTQYFVTDTTGLPGGNYKLEVQFNGNEQPALRTGSSTLQLITIIDRSGDIDITSPASQNLDEALMITGDVQNEGNGGVQIAVSGPNGAVFCPQWIQTKSDLRTGAGVFTQQVTVNTGGTYKVDFSDSNGFIGEKVFTVVAPATGPTTVATSTTPTVVRTTRPVTTLPTPWPTTTSQSPLPSMIPVVALSCAGILAVMTKSRK
jgi:hypothetical protein